MTNVNDKLGWEYNFVVKLDLETEGGGRGANIVIEKQIGKET